MLGQLYKAIWTIVKDNRSENIEIDAEKLWHSAWQWL